MWIKQRDISRLDRCMENTDKNGNFADKSQGLAKHSFHFKKILQKKECDIFWTLDPKISHTLLSICRSLSDSCVVFRKMTFFLIHKRINPLSISPSFSQVLVWQLLWRQKNKTQVENFPIVLPLACIFLALAPHYRLGTIQIKMLGDSYVVLEGDQSLRTWCKMKF